MARYNNGRQDYDTPLAFFDRKTMGQDTVTRAAFAQAVAQTFPKNRGLQRALTDYAWEKGRFDIRIKTTKLKGRGAAKVKYKLTRGKAKGMVKEVTVSRFLSRKAVRSALESGKRTVYINRDKVISLKTARQVAAYRRQSKNPPALIDWKRTARKGVIVFNNG